MEKTLVVDPDRCAGCRTCEAICSFKKEKTFNPAMSRIHIFKSDQAGLDIPSVCQQCDTPLCQTSCPVNAISRQGETNALIIDSDTCIGCGICATACPLGAISIDAHNQKPLLCDLCGGKPMCTQFCPTGAIKHMTATKASLKHRRSSFMKTARLIKRLPAE